MDSSSSSMHTLPCFQYPLKQLSKTLYNSTTAKLLCKMLEKCNGGSVPNSSPFSAAALQLTVPNNRRQVLQSRKQQQLQCACIFLKTAPKFLIIIGKVFPLLLTIWQLTKCLKFVHHYRLFYVCSGRNLQNSNLRNSPKFSTAYRCAK
jgi:hypothetical protein